MSNEDSSNAESIEDSLSWKPPKPTIDLDNINAIEQFLYGSQITSDFNSDCFYDEVSLFYLLGLVCFLLFQKVVVASLHFYLW